MSFCRFIGIEYISNNAWKSDNIDENDLYDLQAVAVSSDSNITYVAFSSVIMNAFYLKTLYDVPINSNTNVNLRRVALGLLIGNTCLFAYRLITSTYNKFKAVDKIKVILHQWLDGNTNQALSQVPVSSDIPNKSITYTQYVFTPAQSLYVNADDGMDDNLDDNSYELNDTSHPIFNVVAHGFEPHLLFRLHLKHPSEFIDSPPFKTSEDAIQFANYIDDLVESDDMFDYVEYLYHTDIKEIYQEYILDDEDVQENDVIAETDVVNEVDTEVQSVEI